MNTLTYVSGPPCSGKSIVCRALEISFPSVVLVSGDTFWERYPDLEFSERVRRTNQRIIEQLGSLTTSHVILEWVPAFAPFTDQLQELCKERNRLFNQIVLHTDLTELKRRKMARDGDEDVVGLKQKPLEQLREALILDTGRMSEKQVQDRCLEWLGSRLNVD